MANEGQNQTQNATTTPEADTTGVVAIHDALTLLIRKGIEMRDYQKSYFKTRSQVSLISSKTAERDFDDLLKKLVGEER